MMPKSRAYKILQFTLASIVIAGTLISVLPVDFFMVKSVRHYTVHFMLGAFALGLISLLLRDKRLMYIAFIGCGIVGAYLQDSFDEQLHRSYYPDETDELCFQVAHFNVSSSEGDYSTTINAMKASKADLISIQEVTPDWNLELQAGLIEEYPYFKSVVRIDLYGMAVFSKYPFERIDTFHYENIPNIIGSVKVDTAYEEIFFVGSHITPPLNSSAYEDLGSHLGKIANYALSFNAPVITFGDYNVVPWSDEIKRFRSAAKLISARRDFTPKLIATSDRFFQSPIDHIFYSDQLKCLGFEPIEGTSSNHLGILGKFQFKYKTPYVKGAIK
ncbi:MAG: endonuclease/exonuclease/phosphatase family protein [Bacteroidota bacterium]